MTSYIRDDEPEDDGVRFFLACAVAAALSLLLWAGIFAAGWWLMGVLRG